MKRTLNSTALGGLLLVLAVTAGPGPAFAENGSDRLNEYRARNQQNFQMKEDSSESFTRMVQEQPTAAGQPTQDDEMRSSGQQTPQHQYQSPIYKQRLEYGK